MPKLSQTAFTDAWLRKLPKPNSRRDHYDAVCRGLGLRHAPSGLKTWYLMKRVGGKMTRHTLGRYPDLSLADARQQAVAQLQAIHLTGTVKKKAQTTSFKAIFDRWMREDQGTNRSAKEVRRAMEKDVLPRLVSCELSSVSRSQIEAILEAILKRGASVHANRILAMLRRLFGWAEGKGLIAVSPVAKMEMPTREMSRERTLTKDELARVWEAAKSLGYPFGPFIRLLILTGQRRSEVSAMEWAEVDVGEALWTQPGTKTKNGRSHVVHLSASALDILGSMGRSSSYVFSTNGRSPISGFSKAKQAIDKESGVTGWTLHDLRRTFATYAAETLGEAPAVVDKVLNHSTGAVTGIAKVYQRAEYLQQRKDLMVRWDAFVLAAS